MDEDSIKPTNGIVGFFDILGYTSMLENCEPEEIAKIIRKEFLNIPSNLNNNLISKLGIKYVDDCFKRIKWLVFSDTIVATLACIDDKDEPAKQKGIDWLCFIPIMNALYCHLFDKGLPIRGAITFGKYLIINHCFAGRAILDAYRVGQSLDLSAITFHQNALSEIKKQMLDKDENLLSNYTVKYLTPLRQKVEEEQQLLLPSLLGLCKINNSDLRLLIANSFRQHNKSIPFEAASKLDNTEHFFRFCQASLQKWGNDSD